MSLLAAVATSVAVFACGSSGAGTGGAQQDPIDSAIAGLSNTDLDARATALRRDFSEEEARYLAALPWQSMTEAQALADIEVRRLLRHAQGAALVDEQPAKYLSNGPGPLHIKSLLGEDVCGGCPDQCSAFERARWNIVEWARRVRDNCINLRPWPVCWAALEQKVNETTETAKQYGGTLNALVECQVDRTLTCAAADQANSMSAPSLQLLGPAGSTCPLPRRPSGPTPQQTDGSVGPTTRDAGVDAATGGPMEPPNLAGTTWSQYETANGPLPETEAPCPPKSSPPQQLTGCLIVDSLQYTFTSTTTYSWALRRHAPVPPYSDPNYPGANADSPPGSTYVVSADGRTVTFTFTTPAGTFKNTAQLAIKNGEWHLIFPNAYLKR